ncbi:hypothetical protein G9A89_019085 [Geosiphon pyriformis]|nr:hypothetical protein G9A89_019085 [Geosiphon pyriformis]
MDEKLPPPYTAVEDFVVPIDEPTPTLSLESPPLTQSPPDTSDSKDKIIYARGFCGIISLTIAAISSE